MSRKTRHAALAVTLAILVASCCPTNHLNAAVLPAQIELPTAQDRPARPILLTGAAVAQAASAQVPTPQSAAALARGVELSPAAPNGWQTLMFEGFEGAFPTTSWATSDISSDGLERYWAKDDFQPHTGAASAWPAAGGPDSLDPALKPYPNNLDTWMIYGPFDLGQAVDAQVVFYLRRQIEPQYDYLFFGASADGTNYDGWTWDSDYPWEEITTSLTAYAGDGSVWIAWYFRSDASITGAGAFVDDIILSQKLPTPPDPPEVSIRRTGSDVSLSWSVMPDADYYEVWRSINAPYFSPGAQCSSAPACTLVAGLAYKDPGAIGAAAQNYAYLVLSADAYGRSSQSNRVGEFDFNLTRGN